MSLSVHGGSRSIVTGRSTAFDRGSRVRALAALDALPREHGELVFPNSDGGYFDLHNFRNRYWQPAQEAAGIEPRRRIYDLRHTFATFALRAEISTFDLSRYMGAIP
jgi:integrase